MNSVNTEGCALIETDKDHLTLTTDDGRDLLCSIVGIFRTPEQSYIVLIPEDGSTQGKGYLMRFALTDDGMPDLAAIEDDAEYAKASDIFLSLTGRIHIEEE